MFRSSFGLRSMGVSDNALACPKLLVEIPFIEKSAQNIPADTWETGGDSEAECHGDRYVSPQCIPTEKAQGHRPAILVNEQREPESCHRIGRVRGEKVIGTRKKRNDVRGRESAQRD